MMEKEQAKQLLHTPTKSHNVADEAEIEAFCAAYRSFLDGAKTERDAVKAAVALAEQAGFRPYRPGQLEPGAKVYRVNREKSLLLAVVGQKPLEEGFRIMASHIDSPRLDLKPMPL